MQQFNSREEREIDLIDLMWRMLMQWKPIVCVMIICGILVVGGMYVKNARDHEAKETQKVQMTEEDMISALSEEEYEDVIAVYNILKQRNAVREYAEESLYLQVDPYANDILTTSYRIDTADETSYSVAAMYGMLLGNDEFMAKLADVTGYKGDLKYIRELIGVSTPGIESSSLVFSFSFTLLPDMDAEAIAKTVDAYVTEEAYGQLHAMKEFTVTKVAQSVKNTINAGTSNTQMDYDARIKSLNASLKSAKDALTEEQKALYEYMAEEEGQQGKEDGRFKKAENEDPVMTKTSMIKYLVVGCFVGAFLYAGCVLLLAIFSPKLQTTGEMADVYRLYMIDELHDKKFKGSLQKFLYDRNVYNLRYGKKNRDMGKSVDEAVKQISGLKDRDEVEKIYLAPLGEGFASGMPADYYAKVTERLLAAGITVERLNESDLKNEILTVSDQAGIVALTNIGDTKYSALDELCGYAYKYGIEILGVVALEL